MKILSRLKTTSAWILLPAVLLGISLAWAVSTYSPLEFVASLYETDSADAVELETVDAEALEGSAEDKTLEASEVDDDLVDGTWTGYATCGVGNGDGWKPYYVATTVVVENGSVASIARIAGSSTGDDGSETLSWDSAENQSYLEWAISGRTYGGKSYTGVKTQLDNAIAQGKSAPSIDVVSGATYSSEAILDSYYAALAKAGSSQSVQVASVATTEDSSDSEASTYRVSEDATVEGALGDGTWTGYAACGVGNEDDWSPYYVAVTVSVEAGAVEEISDIYGTSTADAGSSSLSWNADENQTYLDWAISGRTRSGTFYTGVKTQLDDAVATGGMPSGIDVVSGATYSSESIFEAYYAALRKSAASVGSTVEDPEDEESDSQGGESEDDSGDEYSGGNGESSDDDADDSTDDGDEGTSDDDETEVVLVDGTYLGSAFCQDEDNPSDWSPYYVIAELVVEDGKPTTFLRAYGDTQYLVSPLYYYNASENGSYFSKALNGTLKKTGVKAQIQNALDAGEDIEGIDVISGATWSSQSIFNAYLDALANAYAAAEEAAGQAEEADQAEEDADQTGDAEQTEGTEQAEEGE